MQKRKRYRIVMITFIIAVILVLGGTTISGYTEAARYRRDLNYTYERALKGSEENRSKQEEIICK